MKKKIIFLFILFSIPLMLADSSIDLNWIYPTENINVSQNNFFNITANITCRGGDCGEINVSLDPIVKDVLLIDGAQNTDYLTRNGYDFDTMSETDFANINVSTLLSYKIIIFEPNMNSYDNLRDALPSIQSALEQNKLVVSIRVAANNGNQEDIDFLGTEYDRTSTHNSETFNDSSHLFINGSVYGGHTLVESNFNSWGSTDHGWFTSKPFSQTDYKQILENSDGTSMLEYTYEKGYVMLDTLTSIDGGWGTGNDNVADNYINYLNYTYNTLSGNSKSGLVSTTPGTNPFYTNITNPYNINLNQDESQLITWHVNATGSIETTHKFFIYANLTSNSSISNTTSKLNITIKDTTNPIINITYPLNTTYDSRITELNYSYSDLNPGYCWYSLDNGVTNSSAVSAGTNFDSISSSAGLNNFNLYCNDSSGNLVLESVTFTSTIPVINLSVIYPTENINVIQNKFFNITVNVTCSNNDCGEINVSLDPIYGTGLNYSAYNSSEAESDFEWEEIIANEEGTALWDTGQSRDDGYETASIGFDFPFYSTNYSTIYVSSNGRIHFTTTSASSTSLNLPSRSYKLISPVNEDMYVKSETQVYYKNKSDPNRLIIQYNNLSYYSYRSDYISYQVILYEDGKIKIQYNENNEPYHQDDPIGINYDSSNYLFLETDAPNQYKGMAVTFYPEDYSFSSAKSGLISTETGETPFYTTTQNPYNITLNQDESQLISWQVNATGTLNQTYEFFIYANKTSDTNISDVTEKWNITIVNLTSTISASIVYPENTTYNEDVTQLNYSYFNATSCWYSTNNRLTNSTPVEAGTNFTGLTSNEGSNTWILYCNNSNETSTSSITFTKDTSTPPQISFVNPTYPNATTINANSTEINISIYESNLNELIYNWNSTNYTMYNDSLVLMMNFDNYTRLNDSSSNQNQATCTNCPTWNLSGKYNGAYTFDGINDYINTSYFGEIKTLSFWINTKDFDTMKGQFSQRYDSAEESGNWQMHWDDETDHKRLRIYAYSPVSETGWTNSGNGGDFVTTTNFEANNWYHVVLTSNGTMLKYYVNGQYDNQKANSFVLGGSNNDEGLVIGGSFGNENLYPFNGSLDEIRVWNRTLSADEVYQQYISNLEKFNSTQWYLYVNQSKNATANLDLGIYTYQAFARDSENNFNSTEKRYIIISNETDSINYLGYYNGARLVEISGENGASPYGSTEGNCNEGDTGSWDHMQTICDRNGTYNTMNNKTHAFAPSSSAGSTWSEGGDGIGVLIIDLNQTRIFNELRVFQMFSDGKVTAVQLYENYSNPGVWTQVIDKTSIGPGSGSSVTGGYIVTDPTIISFSDTTSRHVKLKFWNNGSHGSSSYIEVFSAKLFGDGTFVEEDNSYPIFSNYWDNNATLENSGTGLFNVTVLNTNGTVILEINNTNITATNFFSNIYNASYDFISSGNYEYKWHSWSNGTFNNHNSSVIRVYTINATCTPSLTNTSWTNWNNLTCSLNQMNQSRQKTQYDSNNCGEIENQTFYEYQLVGPTYANTSWSEWKNISCLLDNTMNQSRNLTQYDVYSCDSNITFTEYRNTLSCDYCTPSLTNTSWTGWYNSTACRENNTILQLKNLTQYDSNNCGEISNTTFYDSQEISCDYCTPSLTNTSWTGWQNKSACTINDLQLQNRSRVQYDSNFCEETSNTTFYDYQNISCNYCSYNLTNSSWTIWTNLSCTQNNTMNQSRNLTQYDENYESCYAITNLPSDLWNSGNNRTYFEYRTIGYCKYNPLIVSLISPSNNSKIDSSNSVNITFNCSSSSIHGLKNTSLYLTNNNTENFTLNQTKTLTGTSNYSNYTLNLIPGNYTWNCKSYDASNNYSFADSNYSLFIGYVDSDKDNFRDSEDKLNGKKENVITTGVINLNITIGNLTNLTTFNDIQEIVFYAEENNRQQPIINFDYNFTKSSLDLSKIKIQKTNQSLIVNLSNQLQEDYNKTLYIKDNDFIGLCVKDAEISSISEISDNCNESNEINFTLCLGDLNITSINGINCSDLGDRIKITNLRYSGIKGILPESSQENSENQETSNFPSGSRKTSRSSDSSNFCEKNSDCEEDYSCYENQCVKLFDVEILKTDSLIETLHFELAYLVKGMAKINSDIIIEFWIENSDEKISLGKDTIYLGSFEEKRKTTQLNLPYDIEDGNYDLYVQSGYEDYKAQSFRKFNIKIPKEERLKEQKKSNQQNTKETSNNFFLWILILLLILIIILLIIKRTRIIILKSIAYVIYRLKHPKIEISLEDIEDDGEIDNKFLKKETKEIQDFIDKKNKSEKNNSKEKTIPINNSKTKNILGLSRAKVYSESGNFLGVLRKSLISKNKISAWIIKPDKKYNLKKNVLIKHIYVKEINNILIVDERIEDYLIKKANEKEKINKLIDKSKYFLKYKIKRNSEKNWND